MFRTTQHNAASTAQYVIRVKSGDLAPKGKGTLAISVMPDRKVVLRATLPRENGVPEPFDFTSVERLELVHTRNSVYKGRQWIKPVVVTGIAFLGVPTVVEIVDRILQPFLYHFIPFNNPFTIAGLLVHASLVGSTYAAGLYVGSKLNRVARFVATTDDGRHCVAEMPEAAFRFVQGIRAAENLYMEKEASDSAATADVKGTAPSLI